MLTKVLVRAKGGPAKLQPAKVQQLVLAERDGEHGVSLWMGWPRRASEYQGCTGEGRGGEQSGNRFVSLHLQGHVALLDAASLRDGKDEGVAMAGPQL